MGRKYFTGSRQQSAIKWRKNKIENEEDKETNDKRREYTKIRDDNRLYLWQCGRILSYQKREKEEMVKEKNKKIYRLRCKR